MLIMSEDEVRKWKAEQDALYASKNIEDQVAAVLMDSSISGSGLHKDTSLAKAKAIVEMLQKKGWGDFR